MRGPTLHSPNECATRDARQGRCGVRARIDFATNPNQRSTRPVRIVGGKFAGRDLTSPNDRRVRPTAEHVRAGLLDMLGASVKDARVLDLFAGTGALGLE